MSEPLNELTLLERAEVMLGGNTGLPAPPAPVEAQVVSLLEQASIVEIAEPGGGAELPGAMIGGFELEAIAVETVRTHGQRNPGRDFETRGKELKLGSKVKFEPVTRLESHIDGSPEESPRLSLAVPVGDAIVTVLEKRLTDPAERAIPARAGFEFTRGIEAASTRPGQEAEAGIERLAEVREGSKAIQQVVGIIDEEAIAGMVAAGCIAAAESGPARHHEILIAEEF